MEEDYVLSFSITGSGQQQLNEILASFLKLQDELRKTSAASGKAGRGLGNVGDAAASTKDRLNEMHDSVMLARAGLMELVQWGEALTRTGFAASLAVKGLGESVMESLAPNERLALTLKILGKMSEQQALGVQRGIDQLVAATPFLTHQLQGITNALVMGGASLDDWTDAAGRSLTLADAVASGFTRMDEQTTKAFGNVRTNALSIIADFAAVTGNVGARMPTFVFGLQRALANRTGRLLADQLNPEAMKALVGGVGLQIQGSADDVIQRIYQYLIDNNAVGMAALASSTADGIKSNFEEIPQQIFKAIGGDVNDPDSVYSKVKQVYMQLFIEISKIINDPEWKKGIAEALDGVISLGKTVMFWVGAAIAAVLDFAAKHPLLTKIATIFAVIAGAILGLVGVLVTFAAQLGLAAVGMVALYTVMNLHVMPAFAAATPTVLAFGASLQAALLPVTLTVVGLYALYKAMGAIIDFIPGMRNFADGIIVLFSAMSEVISNWKGELSSISEDTLWQLEETGMVTPFLRLVQTLRLVETVMTSVVSGVADLFRDLIGGVEDLASEFGVQMNNMGSTSEGLQEDLSVIAVGVRYSFEKIVETIQTLVRWWSYGMVVWKGFETVIVAGALLIAGAIDQVTTVLGAMWDMFKHTVLGIKALLSGDLSAAVEHAKKASVVTFAATIAEGSMGAVANMGKGMSDQAGEFREAWDFAAETSRRGSRPVGMIGPTAHALADSMVSRPQDPASLQTQDPGPMTVQLSPDSIRALMSMPQVINVDLDGERVAQSVQRHQSNAASAAFTPQEGPWPSRPRR